MRSMGTKRDALQNAAAALALVFAFLLAPASLSARTWPAPTGYVNDFAHVIDPASADSMEALAQELDAKTSVQIAVVTIPSLDGETIDPLAEELYRAWSIGSKGKDQGALILLAQRERRVRIEVGYGLEGLIPDGRAGGIIRDVMGPDLRADRFGPGLLHGVQAIAAIVAADYGVELGRGGSMAPPPVRERRMVQPIVWLVLLVILVIVMNAGRRHRTHRRRGWYDPWGGFGGGLGGLGGFGGGGGGGGFGGGFGGFGGGRSGGGGASGGF